MVSDRASGQLHRGAWMRGTCLRRVALRLEVVGKTLPPCPQWGQLLSLREQREGAGFWGQGPTLCTAHPRPDSTRPSSRGSRAGWQESRPGSSGVGQASYLPHLLSPQVLCESARAHTQVPPAQ